MAQVINGTHFGVTARVPPRPFARLGATLARIGGLAADVLRVIGTRRQLGELDDRMLQDLGISRAQAAFEASRAPWSIGRVRR